MRTLAALVAVLTCVGLSFGQTDPDSGKTFSRSSCYFYNQNTGEHYYSTDTLWLELYETIYLYSQKYLGDGAWENSPPIEHVYITNIRLNAPFVYSEKYLNIEKSVDQFTMIQEFDEPYRLEYVPYNAIYGSSEVIIYPASYLDTSDTTTDPDTGDTVIQTYHDSTVAILWQGIAVEDTLRLIPGDTVELMAQLLQNNVWGAAPAGLCVWNIDVCDFTRIRGGTFVYVGCNYSSTGTVRLTYNDSLTTEIVVVHDYPVRTVHRQGGRRTRLSPSAVSYDIRGRVVHKPAQRITVTNGYTRLKLK